MTTKIQYLGDGQALYEEMDRIRREGHRVIVVCTHKKIADPSCNGRTLDEDTLIGKLISYEGREGKFRLGAVSNIGMLKPDFKNAMEIPLTAITEAYIMAD